MEPAATLPTSATATAADEDPPDAADLGDVDREAEDEEEKRGEDVAEAEEAFLDLAAHRRLREDDAGHQCTDRLREPDLLRERGRSEQEGEHGEQEELARQPVQDAVDHAAEPLRHGERDRDEGDRLADERERLAAGAAAARREAEHEADGEILRDEDGEDEVGLVVCEAAEVDQSFDGDRARRDVDRCCEDERHRS